MALFSTKNYFFFSLISGRKHVCCGYLLEAPSRGASNKYPQHTCFHPEIGEVLCWQPHLSGAMYIFIGQPNDAVNLGDISDGV